MWAINLKNVGMWSLFLLTNAKQKWKLASMSMYISSCVIDKRSKLGIIYATLPATVNSISILRPYLRKLNTWSPTFYMVCTFDPQTITHLISNMECVVL
jgi:hypothetical protein